MSSPQTNCARDASTDREAWHEDVLGKLRQWFSTDFELLDGLTGELIKPGSAGASQASDLQAALCRAVATNGKVAFIEEDDPLWSMAIPVFGENEACLVAVGTFLSKNVATRAQIARLAARMKAGASQARAWMSQQACWMPEVLLRMGELAGSQLSVEWRVQLLEHEVRDLSLHLATNYEEISLLYRLTQNLKLSLKKEELAALALEWMAEIVPAESLAVQFVADKNTTLGHDAPSLITRGNYPLSQDELLEILAKLGDKVEQRPLVINRDISETQDWRWPAVRQLVVVPLKDQDRILGWLVACNHSYQAEFGTVEGILLSSVAAMLGIHSGNTQLFDDQRELFSGMVRALTSAIDAKDPYTCGHSERVARVARRLAQELGCSREQVETIYLAGQLHDVGKIGIDDTVLRKPDKLTVEEYEHIKTHAAVGHRILSDVKQLDQVLPVVLHHHEQWDGKGYPLGLAGEEIPYLARIVAVADAFDAMGSDRPYRKGMDDAKLDEIFRMGAGAQWDASVVNAFFNARDAIRHMIGKSSDSSGESHPGAPRASGVSQAR
ncbi:MAG TPA: HD domain-containing phosphohydrolase [Pirellulales bacterium]|nr:HD domain-containing phosphohydrolase [Pirellulales bacterium]